MQLTKTTLTDIFCRLRITALMALAVIATGLSSCDAVYDDLEECPRGVVMRFVFDYNLEFANAFHSQVDCLSVFIFDADGNKIDYRTETTAVLADENWRMTFDLPAGKYTAVAYGGMDCDQSSFEHQIRPSEIKKLSDLEVRTNLSHIGDPANSPKSPLHDHFHGMTGFTVTEGTQYDHATVEMMRNTNNLRIVLQHLDNSPVDYNNFDFEVTDDNTRFDYANNVLSHKEVTYTPWSADNAYAGVDGLPSSSKAEGSRASDVGMPVQVAFAEFSMSRLMANSGYKWTRSDGEVRQGPRLKIKDKTDGKIIADLPLVNYLLLMKSSYFTMDDQEYLDRAYHHNMIFFLDENNYWVRVHIVVKDWVVRINNVNFGFPGENLDF
ncbi:MAG: FimB/Mfa2 family fimbrial subunit [Muribaculaceae bacterium]|nr:FimB/Mfa2 family fimbrial subunit [Muribaculaceae bacterium]